MGASLAFLTSWQSRGPTTAESAPGNVSSSACCIQQRESASRPNISAADCKLGSVDFRKTGIPAVMHKDLKAEKFPSFFGKDVSAPALPETPQLTFPAAQTLPQIILHLGSTLRPHQP